MPAVMIRQLEALGKVMEQTGRPERRAVLLEQGVMIWRLCESTVPEAADRADVRRRYEALRAGALTPDQPASTTRASAARTMVAPAQRKPYSTARRSRPRTSTWRGSAGS